MALPLPNLDDRTFDDLVEEALAMIPGLAKSWTDHNPSDPGIMLLELFAWLTEMLMFRVDQVTDESKRTFLRLLNEPGWKPSDDLEEDIRVSRLKLRERNRAVTVADYELLTRNAFAEVARVKCIPRRNLRAGTEIGRRVDRPEYISLLIVPLADDEDAVERLSQEISEFFETRRMLTTKLHVVGPRYVDIRAEITIVADDDAMRQLRIDEGQLRQSMYDTLVALFHPRSGGHDGTGWPFGRSVLDDEIKKTLEPINGVDVVEEVTLTTDFKPDPVIREADGDSIGIKLEAHQLPKVHVDLDQIVVKHER